MIRFPRKKSGLDGVSPCRGGLNSYCDSSGRGFGSVPGFVPIETPELLKFRQFHMAVSAGHVNRPRQFLCRINLGGRLAGGNAAMTIYEHSSKTGAESLSLVAQI